MERWIQDLKYAVRSLLKSPQHTLIATGTLALAIGVNTAIFSLVSQILFLELPIEDSEEVFWVWHNNPETGSDITPLSIANFQDFRDRSRSFESLAALVQSPMILTGVDRPERITVASVTANLTEVWGDEPVLGRGFVAGEDAPGGPRVAMITGSLWENRFARDPGVLGETIELDGVRHTIVGVTSPRMEAGNLGRARIWVPLEMDGSGGARGVHSALVTGRLKPGVDLATAQAEAAEIGAALADEHPVENRGWEVQVRTTSDSVLGDQIATIMILLILTVGLVMLIACANVANLVLVRGSARMRELAVRSALGAGRTRLIRQLLTENVIMALAAGGIGIGLAHLLLTALVALTRGRQVLFNMATIDERALFFTLAVSLLAPLVFGLLPAMGSVRGNLSQSLRDGARAGSGKKAGRLRNTLVVSQVALALALMIVSGVLVRSGIALQQLELGFETDGILTMVIDLPDSRYDSAEAGRFFADLEDRVAALPDIRGAALAAGRPSISVGNGTGLEVEGQFRADSGVLPTVYTDVVTEEYFDVLGIPLLAGRTFDSGDNPQTLQVALVSQEAADRFWPNGDAIGSRVRIQSGPDAPWRQIVGVVGNVAGGNDIQNLDVPQVYVPFAQSPRASMVLFARLGAAEAAVAGLVREEVWALDPQQPIDDVRTMGEYIYDLNAIGFAMVSLFMVFAFFALVMAGMGIYGVMSFMVSQRTREIGLRMALGAERSSVLGLVLGQGGRLLAIGGAIGIGIAFLLSRLSASLVFGVEPTDPVTFVGVPVVLAVLALLANLVPARRATRIDPMTALRND